MMISQKLDRDLENTLEAIESAIAQTVSLRQFWLDLSESERRFYFQEFIRRIEICYKTSTEWNVKLIFFI